MEDDDEDRLRMEDDDDAERRRAEDANRLDKLDALKKAHDASNASADARAAYGKSVQEEHATLLELKAAAGVTD